MQTPKEKKMNLSKRCECRESFFFSFRDAFVFGFLTMSSCVMRSANTRKLFVKTFFSLLRFSIVAHFRKLSDTLFVFLGRIFIALLIYSISILCRSIFASIIFVFVFVSRVACIRFSFVSFGFISFRTQFFFCFIIFFFFLCFSNRCVFFLFSPFVSIWFRRIFTWVRPKVFLWLWKIDSCHFLVDFSCHWFDCVIHFLTCHALALVFSSTWT